MDAVRHAPVRTGLLCAALASVPTPAVHPPIVAAPRSAMFPVVTHPAQQPRADSIVQFQLDDQFGRMHDAADYRGRPLYLVGANRVGRASATAWASTLGPLLAGADGHARGAVVAVANLEGVPRVLRGLVRRRFPPDLAQAVLLDWDGAVTRRLAFDRTRSTIVAVGADGRPVLRVATLATDSATVRTFLARAEAAMRNARAEGT